MRIVFVCKEYPLRNRPTGGFGTYVDVLSSALAKKGHKITIICEGDPKLIEESENKVVLPILSIFSALLKKLRLTHITFLRRIGYFLDYPLGFSLQTASVLKKLETQKIDIVEGADFGAELFFYLLFRRATHPKVIIKLHTPSFLIRQHNVERRTLFYRVMEMLEAFCLKQADTLYSPSHDLAKLVRQRYGQSVDSVIPNPLMTTPYKVSKKRIKDLIMFVGKIQRKKGVFVLADALPQILKEVPNAKFWFIGADTIEDGQSTRKKLMSVLKHNNSYKRVTFIDLMPQHRLYKFYEMAAITVLPSLWENFPSVLLEAGKLGSTIIATKSGGIPEIIKNRWNGLLVSPGNSDGLAKAILTLLRSEILRERYAKQMKVYLDKKYRPQKIAAQTIEYYMQVFRV